jgi:hypothetical protein
MQAALKLCHVVYWLALIIWTSALVSAAVAAMNVFSTLPDMAIELERYRSFPIEEHGRLAAGHVMDGVFFLVDVMQFVAVPLVLLALLAQLFVFRMRWTRPANVIRALCLIVAAAAFAFHAGVLAPRMNRNLREFWSAAEAGEIQTAREHRALFHADHQLADPILRLNLVLLLVAVGASAAAMTPASPQPSHQLEQPRLAQPR